MIAGVIVKVKDLLSLANDVLGKVLIPGTAGANGNIVPSFIAINSQVDIINNAFDKCRSIVGYFDCGKTCANIGDPCPPAVVKNPVTSVITENGQGHELKATAYPNPFTDRFSLKITSPVSGMANIEFYNVNGSKVYEMRTNIKTGIEQVVNYTGPVNYQMLFFKVRIDNYKAEGVAIKPTGNLND